MSDENVSFEPLNWTGKICSGTNFGTGIFGQLVFGWPKFSEMSYNLDTTTRILAVHIKADQGSSAHKILVDFS
jgi:hypothetical protein